MDLYQTQAAAALTCLRLPVNRLPAKREPVGRCVARAPQSRGALRTPLSSWLHPGRGAWAARHPSISAQGRAGKQIDTKPHSEQLSEQEFGWGLFCFVGVC